MDPQNPPTHGAVPLPILNGLLKYLDTKPHGEVRGFIDALSQSPHLSIRPEDQPGAKLAAVPSPDDAAEGGG